MRKLLISLFLGTVIALFLLNAQYSIAQDLSSYYQGKKQFYQTSENKIVVRFRKEATVSVKNQILHSLVNEKEQVGEAGNGISIIVLKNNTSKEKIQHFIKEYKNNDEVISISPILLNQKSEEIGALTEQFIVRLKTNTNITQLQRLVTQTRTQIVEQYKYDKQTYILAVNKNSQGNALEMANLFYESGLFEWSEPDFLLFIDKGCIPNDVSFNQQWYLRNTQQFGGITDADIDAEQAWCITTGSSSIKVAVLDDGIQSNHPDLLGNILLGYNATNGTNNTEPAGSEPHGTFVAGIIAARANNQEGIAGIAYNNRVVPIKVLTAVTNLDTMSTAFGSALVAGIDWAWHQGGVDVMNMSFRIGINIQNIETAIQRAITQGRGGKGCVMVGITHNQNRNGISFPASNPNMIAVGASNPFDEKASFSNYGLGIDIVAPGEQMFSTDLTLQGYNQFSNYDFQSGTSFASPLVAGTAALILSLNPNLTQSQVRRIIELTAEKKGGNVYQSNVPGQPNGTWNQFMGHGRLDTHQALLYTQNYCLPTSVSSSLISVSGQGMTVTQSGLNLAVIYNGSFISSTPNSQNIDQVEWQSLSSSVYVSQSGITATAYLTNGCVGGIANMRVRVRNICGLWSDWRMFTVNVCSNSGFRFVYSPNPTSEVLTITAVPTEENKNLTIAAEVDFEVKLIDQDGKVVREGKNQNKEKKLSFDVKGLKEGTYYLHILYGKEIEKHQVLVGK
ncbi:S8 family serine peptidase [Thermoflexibacter ruber]|uniref:Por secretion system C-terminal sorting domain-containing protein n=1 Tax=Thermoflexibacter ruber TaxID=1003 RepID=A0A1I2KBN2_9BACT|nr:S8 family serine peptidase [Thermoflexibacter ruber]SFF63873.1 Por secretion system C-terminal sorting domain-containing protein [Thermoflexibacter ruber]